jgi:hypothetical protein
MVDEAHILMVDVAFVRHETAFDAGAGADNRLDILLVGLADIERADAALALDTG